ncbi:MAG: TonB-dependent receptor [Sphingomicrobium sp.]
MPPRFALFVAAATSLAAATAAPAQEGPAAPQPTGSPALEEEDQGEAIVITAARPRGSVVGDIPPQNVLNSGDVRATGATSINELLSALAPQIGSAQGRGGGAPVLLLGGQRISGFRELRDIPIEAIDRVEILPEEVALKYGYGADQKVVNIVLRQRFRSTTAQLGATSATDSGYSGVQGDLTRLLLGAGGRTTFNLRAEGNGLLTEAERDVLSAGSTAGAGQARSLIGSRRLVRGSATANRTIFGDVSATLNGEFEHAEGRSLLGLAPSTFEVLGRDTRSDNAHGGLALNGDKSGWRWSVTGNADLERSKIGTDRDDPLFARDRSRQTRASGDLSAVANRKIVSLPAGDAGLTVRVGASSAHLNSKRLSLGDKVSTSLGRTQSNAALSADVPISRREQAFSALGNLTLNANAEVQRLSDFGTLTRIGAGANWSPLERLDLIASWSREDGAPSIQQLGDAVLETPDARIFDFTAGRTILATVITGGNASLDSDRRSVWKLSGNWQPLKDVDVTLRADYVHSVIDRPVQNIFGPTPTLEAAFPGRFVRDSMGNLTSADLRPINFDEARRDTLRLGFDFTRPLKSKRPSQGVIDQLRAQFRGSGAPRSSPADSGTATASSEPGGGARGERGGERGGGGGGFFGGNRGRMTLSLTDTLTFVDQVSIGPGLAQIDYLRGDAAGSSGGTPRHRVEAQAGWFNNGLGARLSANWRSRTRVSSLTAGDLEFSPLATFDLRLFANLGEQPEAILKYPLLRGSSIRLEIANLTNARPRVRDAAGAVPLNYQADLLDPLGRTFMIRLRKQFLPPRGSLRPDQTQPTR